MAELCLLMGSFMIIGMYKEIQPPGRKDAEAIDVNDSGIVVGSESGSTKCFIAIPKELFE